MSKKVHRGGVMLRNRMRPFSRMESKRRDTIPKPVGLGSRGPLYSMRLIEYSMNIRCLFNVCSKFVQCRLRTDRLRPGTF